MSRQAGEKRGRAAKALKAVKSCGGCGVKYIIDRIENNIAICETEEGKIIGIPVEKLPAGATEGDILRSAGAGDALIRDAEARSAAESKVKRLMRKLWDS